MIIGKGQGQNVVFLHHPDEFSQNNRCNRFGRSVFGGQKSDVFFWKHPIAVKYPNMYIIAILPERQIGIVRRNKNFVIKLLQNFHHDLFGKHKVDHTTEFVRFAGDSQLRAERMAVQRFDNHGVLAPDRDAANGCRFNDRRAILDPV